VSQPTPLRRPSRWSAGSWPAPARCGRGSGRAHRP
jgi:hypothetical protein